MMNILSFHTAVTLASLQSSLVKLIEQANTDLERACVNALARAFCHNLHTCSESERECERKF